jgi:hypothetical protein
MTFFLFICFIILVLAVAVPIKIGGNRLMKSLDISISTKSLLRLPTLKPLMDKNPTTFHNAFLPDGSICWRTVEDNQRQQRTYRDYKAREEESKSKKKQYTRKPYTREPYSSKKARSSQWYKDYVESDQCRIVGSRKAKKFRRRFRLPYLEFLKLMDTIREENWFPSAENVNCVGEVGLPLEILVLGALRYLGRGWTFDDLEEASGISEESHRLFLHAFVAAAKEHLFPKWVKPPKTNEEVKDCMAEFEEAGFNGCIGSTDATHVVIEKCYKSLRNQHLGAKST